MKHTLLPQFLQKKLMDAAATKNLEAINYAIHYARRLEPSKFHTEQSLKTRAFFHEPIEHINSRPKNYAAQ